MLKVAFYSPLKPIDHPLPSGDRTIARNLVRALEKRGHRVWVASRFEAPWFWLKPRRLARFPLEAAAARARARGFAPDLWLTYHCYWKAPDALGPRVSRALGVPYFIVEASYSGKGRKKPYFWPGWRMNLTALQAAAAAIANQRPDLPALERVLPPERIGYLPPGLAVEDFPFDAEARRRWRAEYGVGEETPVIACAAMMRPGRKVRGIVLLLKALALVAARSVDFRLVLLGGGEEEGRVRREAAALGLGPRIIWGGVAAPEEMPARLSAADLFAFPGIGEALGMVYLEAQCVGLPVVALRDGGIPEMVRDGETALLVEQAEPEAFAAPLEALLGDAARRRRMGERGREFVRRERNLDTVGADLEKYFLRHLPFHGRESRQNERVT